MADRPQFVFGGAAREIHLTFTEEEERNCDEFFGFRVNMPAAISSRGNRGITVYLPSGVRSRGENGEKTTQLTASPLSIVNIRIFPQKNLNNRPKERGRKVTIPSI